MSVYNLVVTSCGRHELLKETLTSFYETADSLPRSTFIIEDSDAEMPTFLREAPLRSLNITWISNGRRMGQVFAINRVIDYLPKDYEFVCWLEDDWHFHQSQFIRKSMDILQAHPEISQVAFRSDWNHPLVDDTRFPCEVAEPGWGGHWGGWTWNPHMTRLSTLKRFGSYLSQAGIVAGLKHEAVFSQKFLDAGFRIGALPFHCKHTGDGCSVAVKPLPPSPKLLIAIPACFAFEYGRWESDDSPRYDQRTAWEGRGYGTGIHISGDNDRVEAIRDTWAKDIAPFDNITTRFFYGRPKDGYPREPLPDEVFLDVPDDYAHLPQKTVGICRWANDRDFDFLYKGDDDTAVYVDRLVAELAHNLLDYGGCEHHGVCTGGPGYILSRHAFRLAAHQGGSPDHWAEDVWVSKIMNRNNIYPVNLPGHRSGATDHWFYPDGFDPGIDTSGVVAMHAMKPQDLRNWYAHKENHTCL